MRLLRTLFLTTLLLLGAGGVCEAAEVVSNAITVTDTTTSTLTIPRGQTVGSIFSVEVTNIGSGDTWTFKLQYVTADGSVIDLTSTTSGVTTTGITNFSLISPYGASTAVPWPSRVVATRSVAGGTPTVTYRIRILGLNANNNTAIQSANASTYLVRDADTGYILVYLDGSLKATITPRGVIPGACGSDLYAMETGTRCVDPEGRSIAVGPDGPIVVTGTTP